MRAQKMCLCELLQPCANRTEIHILQHRREKQHAFNTVRLLKLGLGKIRLHEMPTDRGQGFPRPLAFPTHAGVLYPGDDSENLATLDPSARPASLVVIDGTWDQAHRMYRDNAWLRSLKRYRLEPQEPSRYRIRKEPRAECLSTLESTVMALSLLEPETPGLDRLVEAFDRMNDRQVECIEQHAGSTRRVKRKRARAMRAVPEPLWAEPERIIVAYGESALPFLHRHKRDRELAQWSAIRLSEPERLFDAIVATEGPMPSDDFLRDLEWNEADIARARPLGDVQRAWRDFLRPGDTVVAWNKSTLAMARGHALIDAGMVLKSIYGNTTTRQFGTLEDVLRYEALQPIPGPAVAGRASRRLANAHAAALQLGRWARQQQGL